MYLLLYLAYQSPIYYFQNNQYMRERPETCEQSNHEGVKYKSSPLFIHSTRLYDHYTYKTTGTKYIWACEYCVDRDHTLYENGKVTRCI